ncbi:MAG: LiaF transmembrane domain-containing protein, partial [Terriglobales bacterium]
MSEGTPQASPATPQPDPVAPRRSFAGPLALILVGVVFLLANTGMLAMRNIGLWFANYWPVLLILWGLHKLWEYNQAKQGGYT